MKFIIGVEEENEEKETNKTFELKEILPCYAEPGRIRIVAQIKNENLNFVLPILYLAFPNSKYSEQTGQTYA